MKALFSIVFLLFTACTGDDVVLPNEGPITSKKPTATLPPIEIKREIDCCWCTVKPDNHNEVRNYGGKELCEDRSGKHFYNICRKVRAMGNRCSLTQLQPKGRGKFECQPLPLKYVENDVTKEIMPPADLSGPCRPDDWFFTPAAPMPKKEKGDELNEDGSPKDDVFCGCGRDETNEKNCWAIKTVNGQVTVLDSKPIPEGEINCTRQVCERIWDFSTFLGVCPRRFVQSPP